VVAGTLHNQSKGAWIRGGASLSTLKSNNRRKILEKTIFLPVNFIR
jgi:hypothetical protein